MSKPKRISKKYTDYFDIEKDDDITSSYERNYEKLDEALSLAGHFVFLTNDLKCTPLELIQLYRGRDTVEKAFDNLKNALDFNRLKIHLNQTTDGKVFVAFIALILRIHLQTHIKKIKRTQKFTISKVLLELEKIKVVTLHHDKHMLMPLTKTQKNILEALDLDPQALRDDAKSL